jgi:hypothetical protein
MLAFDLVNPATPKLVGAPLQLDGVVQSLAAAGDVVYVGMVTDSRSGQTLPELAKLQTVEVTAHGASPVADMPYDGDMGRILALPGRVVVLSGLDIYLLGADDPLRPVGWDRRSLYEEADRAALPPGEHRSMYQYRNAVSGKALYMPVETRRAEDSDMHSGLVVIDVPSESQPYPTPKFIPWATGLIQRVALADDVLVVSSLMDVPPPGTDTCRLIGLDSSTMAHGGLDVELPEPVACDGQVAAANGVLVVASDGARTVYLVDPRRTPALFSQISLPRRESGMLFDKGLIYRADGRGLTVLDAAEDASGEIALRGHLAWPNEGGEITSMVVQDGVLYAASSMPDMVDSAIRPHGGALRIVDVADPGAPRLLSTWSAPGHLQSMVVVGKQGYVVQSIDESCGDGCTGSQEYLTALDLDDLLSPQPGWMYQPMLSAVLAGIPDHVLQYDFCMPSSTELVPCVIVDGLNKAGTASGTNSVHLPDTDFFEAPAMTVGGANKHLVLKSRTPQGRATLYDVDLRDLSRLSARPLELPSYKELEGSWNVPNLHFAIGGTTLFAMEERDDGLFALDLAQPGAWQRRAATVSGDEFYHLATDGNRLAVISDVGLWLLPVDEARR